VTWWLSDVRRATHEQSKVAELAEQVGWLSAVNWSFGENIRLTVDFNISHGDEVFALFLTYPSSFPDTPPVVKPRDSKRLSAHQYGAGGELCLEFRPDNWDPEITGAMMIESAYRLISGERPDEGGATEVPSAHIDSIGRRLRSENMRLILPREALPTLNGLDLDVPTPIQAWDHFIKPTWVATITAIGTEDSVAWTTEEPRPLMAVTARGLALRTEQTIRIPTGSAERFELLTKDFAALSGLISADFNGFVLFGNGEQWFSLNLFPHEGKSHVVRYETSIAPSTAGRLPSEHEALAGKHVAIVGCGSVGSKVAVMLARAGVRTFTLVDEDVFFAANLVRNELNADALGFHKVDALAARISGINASAQVTRRRIALGQQESAVGTETVMQDLTKADLIVEATADPRAFNLAGAVAQRRKKAFVWCEVFGGGIGGIVVRLRPDVEPPPSGARAQIRAWCESHNIPWLAGDSGYSGRANDGAPLIADDADVSVIAAHAARAAIDVLTKDQTGFPAPAYAVGLSRGWIFTAPFETWPIELHRSGTWGASQGEASEEEVLQFIQSIAPKESQA